MTAEVATKAVASHVTGGLDDVIARNESGALLAGVPKNPLHLPRVKACRRAAQRCSNQRLSAAR